MEQKPFAIQHPDLGCQSHGEGSGDLLSAQYNSADIEGVGRGLDVQ